MKLPFFLFILSVANALANDLDFTLVNQTGRSFEGLYITASDNKDWDAIFFLTAKCSLLGKKSRCASRGTQNQNFGISTWWTTRDSQ